jgi:hypothetical protein
MPEYCVKHTLPALSRSVVDDLKVGMKGGGEFRKQLIGGDYAVTVIYSEVKNQYTSLFSKQEEQGVPDEKYR